MPFQRLTEKKATARTPQVVTIVIDDSGSMSENQKCSRASEGAVTLVRSLQTANQGSSGTRFIVSIAKFGSSVSPMATAERPEDVPLTSLVFTGDSGGTEMVSALEWAAQATQSAIKKAEATSGFLAENTPNPVVYFLSDGANTGGDISAATAALKATALGGTALNVVAVGIGMLPTEFPVMQQIATTPDLAANINPVDLADFLAGVGATLQRGESPKDLLVEYQ